MCISAASRCCSLNKCHCSRSSVDSNTDWSVRHTSDPRTTGDRDTWIEWHHRYRWHWTCKDSRHIYWSESRNERPSPMPRDKYKYIRWPYFDRDRWCRANSHSSRRRTDSWSPYTQASIGTYSSRSHRYTFRCSDRDSIDIRSIYSRNSNRDNHPDKRTDTHWSPICRDHCYDRDYCCSNRSMTNR